MFILNKASSLNKPGIALSTSPFYTKYKVTLLLMAISAFGCFLLTIRILRTGDFYFLFLPWNLLLAWMPYWLSLSAYNRCLKGKFRWPSAFLWILWWILYPNAPYIITDLGHLNGDSIIPKWYDSLMVFSFALTGLLIGIASLHHMHAVMEQYFGKLMGWLFVMSIATTTGFGIYIGRILRWNSWDILFSTVPLLHDVSTHILSPTAVIMTLSFSAFIGMGYFLFHALISGKPV